MSAPVIVPFLIALGCFLFALALFWPRIHRLKERRALMLARLSGRTKDQPLGPALRREDAGTLAPTTTTSHLQWRQLELLERINPRGLAIALFAMTGLMLVLRLFFGIILPVALGLAAVLVVVIWIALARARLNKRYLAIADTIPEAFEMIARSLRVGFPIHAALLYAAERLTGPLGEELRVTAEKVAFGQDVSSALYALARRCQNSDLRFFAAAVSIQIATGGNLAEMLERLSTTARARQQLARKVTAITAEARWSGRFLSAFPVLASGALYMLNPSYFDALVNSNALWIVLTIAGVLVVVNVIYMRWLCQLD